MLMAIAFYIFAAVLLISSFVVITARNQVYSVLALILAFFNAAGLFVLLGAEFLAMLLIVVYVGAVAVLFLFVVMMLGSETQAVRPGHQRYALIGSFVGIILALELAVIYAAHFHGAPVPMIAEHTPAHVSNIVAIGSVLYTDYVYAFQIAGLILFVAMIGAIVMCLRHRPGTRHQGGWRQVSREAARCIEIVDIPPGKGAE